MRAGCYLTKWNEREITGGRDVHEIHNADLPHAPPLQDSKENPMKKLIDSVLLDAGEFSH
jgi:hypothetical protein